MEDKIRDYIGHYFNDDELKIMKKNYIHNYTYDDSNVNDLEYIELSELYKRLMNISVKGKYRVEVDKDCSSLIKTLFKRYVTTDTFVVTTLEEHFTVIETLDSIPKKNTYQICTGNKDHLSKDLVNNIITAYNKSNCKNMLLLIPGVVPGFGYVISQNILYQLKFILNHLKIPHIFALDDCQGIMYTPRDDYDIFDVILCTAHVLFLGFDMGICFTKLNQRIGYVNKTGLKRFAEKLEILSKYKDKGNEFGSLLEEYFNSVLNNRFSIADKDKKALNSLNISINDSVVLPQQAELIHNKYLFTFNEVNAPKSWFRIRLHESIIQSPDRFIKGLKETKQLFQKLTRYNDLNYTKSFGLNNQPFLDTEAYNPFQIYDEFYQFTDEKIIEQTKRSIDYMNSFKFFSKQR